jgi:hypothetical protein
VLCTAPRARCIHFNIHGGFPTNRHKRSCVRGGTGDGGNGAPAEGDTPTENDRDEADNEVEDFVWGGLGDAPTEDDRSDADDEVEDFVWGGSEKTPKKIEIAACMPCLALTPRARTLPRQAIR